VDIPANNFSVSLKDQEVLVWGASKPPFEEVKAKIAKTGKKVSSKSLVLAADTGNCMSDLVCAVRGR
jgi:hypothetical protein